MMLELPWSNAYCSRAFGGAAALNRWKRRLLRTARAFIVHAVSVALVATQTLLPVAQSQAAAAPRAGSSAETAVSTIDPLPPGSQDPGVVDPLTGKARFSQPIASVAGVSPGYDLELRYSSMGLYEAVTTWNAESQAIETGLGWSAPALHQHIVRKKNGTGYTWDDEYFIQAENKLIKLIPVQKTTDGDGAVVARYTTADSDYSTITWYQNGSTVDPDNIYNGGGGDGSYTPSYWEVVNKSGTIYRYGDYKSEGSLFAIKGVKPYAKLGESGSAADLTGGEKSAQLCAAMRLNSVDGCSFVPIEYNIRWNAFYGPSINAGTTQKKGADSGQEYLESLWNLTEIENPGTGLATTLSYACHTQPVGRQVDVNTGYYASGSTAATSTGKSATIACYLYQAATSDGNFISLDYLGPGSPGVDNAKSTTAAVGANQTLYQACAANPDLTNVNRPQLVEIVDPQQTDPEPDAYQEVYRTLRLVGAGTYSGAAVGSDPYDYVLAGRTSIDYCPLNDVANSVGLKPVPVRVASWTPLAGSSSFSKSIAEQAAPATRFNYFNSGDDGVTVDFELAAADRIYDAGALFGALKSVVAPGGAELFLSYSRNDLSASENGVKQSLAVPDGNAPIPNRSRTVHWGADFVAIAGEWTDGDHDAYSIAIFTFGAAGWELSRVLMQPDAKLFVKDNSITQGPISATRSNYDRAIAVGDGYIAYLYPQPAYNTSARTCAAVGVAYRRRDANGDVEWVDYENSLGGKTLTVQDGGKDVELVLCRSATSIYYSESGGGDSLLHNYQTTIVPSIAAHNGMIVAAGYPYGGSSQEPKVAAWYSADAGQTFANRKYEAIQEIPDGNQHLIEAYAGPGYGAAYTLSYKSLSSQTDVAKMATTLRTSYFTVDELGNAGALVNASKQMSLPNFERFGVSWGFQPKDLVPYTVGGFPVVRIAGTYQLMWVTSDPGGYKWTSPRYTSYELLVWHFFDEADDAGAVDSLKMIQTQAAENLAWGPVYSSGKAGSSDRLQEARQQQDADAASNLLGDAYGDFGWKYSGTNKPTDNTYKFTSIVGNGASAANGTLWSAFSHVAVTDGARETHRADWYTCRFDEVFYNSDLQGWGVKSSQIVNGPGNYSSTGQGSNGQHNSCMPGDSWDNIAKNANVYSGGGPSGVFTTMGYGPSYKIWSYGPYSAQTFSASSGYQASSNKTGALYPALVDDNSAAMSVPEQVSEKEWARIFGYVSTGVGIAGIIFAMAVSIVNPAMLVFVALDVGMMVGAQMAQSSGYNIKAGLSGPGMFPNGRYLLDGRQLWFVGPDARNLSALTLDLFENDGGALAFTLPYAGFPSRYLLAQVAPQDRSYYQIAYLPIRGGRVWKTGYPDSMNLGEVLRVFGGAQTDSSWIVSQNRPVSDASDNNCRQLDCGQVGNDNLFLTYDTGSNSSNNFFDSDLPFFQLNAVHKDSPNHMYDFVVSQVVVDDGYQQYTTNYEYGDSTYNLNTQTNEVAYASLHGLTARYSDVRIYRGGDAQPAVRSAYTRIKYYSSNPEEDQPSLHYALNPEPGSTPPAVSDNEAYLRAAEGLPYLTQQVRVSSDGSETIVRSNAVEYAIIDYDQSDANGARLMQRRGVKPISQVASYDHAPDADAGDYSQVTTTTTYGDYYLPYSSTSTRVRFDHGSQDGAPLIGDDDSHAITHETQTIRAYEVAEYQDALSAQNRLDEIYAVVSLLSEDDGDAYIKSATVGVYDTFQKPVGGDVLLNDQAYGLVRSLPWSSREDFVATAAAGIADADPDWLAGPTRNAWDPITFKPTQQTAATGEASVSLISYADEDDALASYPIRLGYASFGYGKVAQQDGALPLQATYVGFEEYEHREFAAGGTQSSCSASERGLSIANGFVQGAQSTASSQANTGRGFCSPREASDALTVSLNETFSQKAAVDYVVSAWARPNVGGSCSITVGTGDNNIRAATDSDYYADTLGVAADGKRWFYLEATVEAGTVIGGQEIVQCAGALDDIRVSPAASAFRAVVYDTDKASASYGAPIASLSDHGLIARHIIEPSRGRPYLTVVQDIDKPQCTIGASCTENVFTLGDIALTSGLSRWNGFNSAVHGETGQFDPATPNFAMSAIVPRGVNTAQYRTSLTNDSLTLPSEDRFILRFQLDRNNLQQSPDARLDIDWGKKDESTAGSLAIEFSNTTTSNVTAEFTFNDNEPVTLTGMAAPPQDYLLLVQNAGSENTSLVLFVDGRRIGSWFPSAQGLAADNTGDLQINISGSTVLRLVAAPVTGGVETVYTDAAGRSIEGHSLSGFADAQGVFHYTDIAAATWMDGWGRAAAAGKPIELSSPQDAQIAQTGRAYNPGNVDLLAFRGVQTLAAGRPGRSRNMGMINWNGAALTPDTGNVLTFEIAVVPKTGAVGPYSYLVNGADVGADPQFELTGAIAEASASINELKWQRVSIALDDDDVGLDVIAFSAEDSQEDSTYLLTYIRRLALNGLAVDDAFEGNGAASGGGRQYCLIPDVHGAAAGELCEQNGVLLPEQQGFMQKLYLVDGEKTARLDSSAPWMNLYRLGDKALANGASYSQLRAFYSGGAPGQAFYGNDDDDALYALVAARADNSPLARTGASEAGPGELYSFDNAQASEAQDFTSQAFYQSDPLDLMKGTGADDAENQLSFNTTSRRTPTGEDAAGLVVSDLLGKGVFAAAAWYANDQSESARKTLYTGSAYDVLAQFKVQTDDDDDDGVATFVGQQVESRQPEWYETDHDSDNLGAPYSHHLTGYMLSGQWASEQRSDSAEGHVFQDNSGRTRVVLTDPQFGADFSAPAGEQIAAYNRLDEYGRTIESGRFKAVSQSAYDWLTLARDVDFDSNSLLDAQACTVGVTAYDTYESARLYYMDDDGVQNVIDLADDSEFQPYLAYGRGANTAVSRYNRTVTEDGWNDGPLSSAACNNSAADPVQGMGNYILNTGLVDQFGRMRASFTNIVTVATQDVAAQSALYATRYTQDDLGLTASILQPSDAQGHSGAVVVTVEGDRLSRPMTIARTVAGQEDQPLWQVGEHHFGMPTSTRFGFDADAAGNETYVERTVTLNFQNLPIRIAQLDQDGASILLEEFGYAQNMLDSSSDAYAACSSFGYRSYANGRITWRRTSGSAWYDSEPIEGLQPDSDERCFAYDGAGRLTAVKRVDRESGRDDLHTESFAYDANGNLLARNVQILTNASSSQFAYTCRSSVFTLEKTTGGEGANNQVAAAVYENGQCTSVNEAPFSAEGGGSGGSASSAKLSGSFDYDERYGSLDSFFTADGSTVSLTRDNTGFRPVRLDYDSPAGAGSYSFADGALGRTVETYSDGSTQATRHLIYAGDLTPFAEFETSSGETVAAYNLGASRLRIAEAGAGDAQAIQIVRDHLGSAVGLLRGGAVAVRYAYDTTGQPTEADACDSDCEALREYPYLYQRQRFLRFGETVPGGELAGLFTFPARLYDPSQARWLSQDPAQASLSPYSAMDNDWINRIDPSGSISIENVFFLALIQWAIFIAHLLINVRRTWDRSPKQLVDGGQVVPASSGPGRMVRYFVYSLAAQLGRYAPATSVMLGSYWLGRQARQPELASYVNSLAMTVNVSTVHLFRYLGGTDIMIMASTWTTGRPALRHFAGYPHYYGNRAVTLLYIAARGVAAMASYFAFNRIGFGPLTLLATFHASDAAMTALYAIPRLNRTLMDPPFAGPNPRISSNGLVVRFGRALTVGFGASTSIGITVYLVSRGHLSTSLTSAGAFGGLVMWTESSMHFFRILYDAALVRVSEDARDRAVKSAPPPSKDGDKPLPTTTPVLIPDNSGVNTLRPRTSVSNNNAAAPTDELELAPLNPPEPLQGSSAADEMLAFVERFALNPDGVAARAFNNAVQLVRQELAQRASRSGCCDEKGKDVDLAEE